MVTKTERCTFTEYRIVPGRGRRFVAKDGRVHHIWGSKARCLFHRKIKPVKLTWTLAWRAFNKKIKIDESTRRRSKKTTRVQKAVVGMSLDEIKRRKAESREDRNKVTEANDKAVKDRKQKSAKDKKDKNAKATKASKPKKSDVAKAAPAGKKANVAVRK